MEPTSSEWIEVRNSFIHGTGVFAAKDIPKGTKIIEYVGRKVSKKEAEIIAEETLERAKSNPSEGAVYLFEVNDDFDIDGNVEWNTAKFINHSCDPNCETEQDEEDRIWILSIREIKKGEELFFNYGYDLDDWKNHPCKCGSAKCVGYIADEKHWKKLEKLKKSLL